MGDRALQRQHRRQPVGMRGEALDLLRRLESHVIVAMRRLRRAAGIDDIDLRGDLVAGCRATPRSPARPRCWRSSARTAADRAGRAFPARSRCGRWRRAWRNDRRRWHWRRAAPRSWRRSCRWRHRPRQDRRTHPRTAGCPGRSFSASRPLRHQRLAALRLGRGAADVVALVGQNVVMNGARQRVIGEAGVALDQPPEILQAAIGVADPDACGFHRAMMLQIQWLWCQSQPGWNIYCTESKPRNIYCKELFARIIAKDQGRDARLRRRARSC